MSEPSVETMSERFILWRCLHRGPLSKESIDEWPPEEAESWQAHRAKNVPLLRKLIQVYGTCAVLAWDGDRVIGTLRFYPKVLYSMDGAGSSLCILQEHPSGVSDRLVENRFPPLHEIPDKTLRVHCWGIAPAYKEGNPFRPGGFGTRMMGELVRWATDHGWKGIELTAFEDTEHLNVQFGMPGRRAWEALGFRVVETGTADAPWFLEALDTMREQLSAQGLDPDAAQIKYTMRAELTEDG